MTKEALRASVVVPAHQAAADIAHCIRALHASGFAADEIIVVDDGSRDGTGIIAESLGARVHRNEVPQRPAEARNRGAFAIDQQVDIIVFVDADVLVHAGTKARLLAAFAADPGLSAIFGSYDDVPPAPSVVSRYRNLLHHFVHQTSRADAGTFWTGLGAVRHVDFVALGGFRRAWEDIEDVDFGIRLKRKGGRIRLDRHLLATHRKRWTFRSMFRTDLRGRAIPWSRLLMRQDGPRDDLNLTRANRISVALVGLMVAGTMVSVVDLRAVPLVLCAAAGFIGANRAFLHFLVRGQGLGFAIVALPYHMAHYLAAGLGYGWVLLAEAPSRWRSVAPVEATPPS